MPESKSRLKKVGAGALVPLVVIGVLVLVGLLIRGMVWASEKALPLLTTASEIALGICIFIFAPLCIFKRLRPLIGLGFYFASYLFGICLFAFSCIVTVALWGYGGLAVGLLLGGIGVVPVAFLATLFHGAWEWLLNLVISFVITFGARAIGAWLITPARNYEPMFDDDEAMGAGQ